MHNSVDVFQRHVGIIEQLKQSENNEQSIEDNSRSKENFIIDNDIIK